MTRQTECCVCSTVCHGFCAMVLMMRQAGWVGVKGVVAGLCQYQVCCCCCAHVILHQMCAGGVWTGVPALRISFSSSTHRSTRRTRPDYSPQNVVHAMNSQKEARFARISPPWSHHVYISPTPSLHLFRPWTVFFRTFGLWGGLLGVPGRYNLMRTRIGIGLLRIRTESTPDTTGAV